jgi:hypothetical protein
MIAQVTRQHRLDWFDNNDAGDRFVDRAEEQRPRRTEDHGGFDAEPGRDEHDEDRRPRRTDDHDGFDAGPGAR